MLRRSSSMNFVTPDVGRRTTSVINRGRSSSGAPSSARLSKGPLAVGGRVKETFVGSVSKRSSVGAKGKVGASSGRGDDLRNIRSKEFQEEARMALLEFLEDKDPKGTMGITEEHLKTASSGHFRKLMEFMYSWFDENQKIDSKTMVDVVPRIFKDLGYPFEIKRSTIQAVGHSWPILLAALRWLLDLIRYAINIEIADILFSDGFGMDDNNSQLRILFNYHNLSYVHDEDDTYPMRFLRTNLFSEETGLKAVELEYARLEKTLVEYREKVPEDDLLREQREKIKTQILAANSKCAAVSNFVEEQTANIGSNQKEMEKMRKQIEELQTAVEDKRQRIEKQPMSSNEVQSLMFEKRQIGCELEVLKKKNDKAEDDWHHNQIQISKKAQEVSSAWSDFSVQVNRLVTELLPDDEDFPFDLETINPHAKKFPRDVSDLKKYLAFGSDQLQEQCLAADEKLSDARQKKYEAEAELDELNVIDNNKATEVKAADTTLEDTRKKHDYEANQLAESLKDVLAEIESLKKLDSMNIDEKQQELIRLEAEKIETNEKYNKEVEAATQELLQFETHVYEKIDKMTRDNERLETIVEKKLASVVKRMKKSTCTPDDLPLFYNGDMSEL